MCTQSPRDLELEIEVEMEIRVAHREKVVRLVMIFKVCLNYHKCNMYFVMRMLKGPGSETFNTSKDWNLSMSEFTRLGAFTPTENGEDKCCIFLEC